MRMHLSTLSVVFILVEILISSAFFFMIVHGALAAKMSSNAFRHLCQEGKVTVTRQIRRQKPKNDNKQLQEFQISYRIFRPMALSSQKAAPVVALHGGPSLPSDYLEPLVDVIPYRSIVLYDQLGCGKSDEPKDVDLYSVENAVDDLEVLIQKLGLRRFHLYGHSFGGMIAYDYIKRVAERKGKLGNNNHSDADQQKDGDCLSIVLSSTSTSMPLVEKQWDHFVNDIKKDKSNNILSVMERFRRTHQCRTSEMPTPLVNAYKKLGSTWVGMGAVRDYELHPPSAEAARMPSAMVLRGEYDFTTEECTAGWKSLFNHPYVREKVLEDCSHHILLERGETYGEILESFFSEYD